MTASKVLKGMAVSSAIGFKEAVANDKFKLYATLGKTVQWDILENTPTYVLPTPTDTNEDYATYWDNTIGLRRIYGYDIMHVIPKIEWGIIKSFNLGDVVVVNTLDNVNKHNEHGELVMCYQCVETPTTGSCSITAIDKDECLLNGGTWTSTATQARIDNIPRGTDSGFDSGDGYKWDYLYSIPRDVMSKITSNKWIPVPDILESRVRWAINNEVVYASNRLLYKCNANHIIVNFRVDGNQFTNVSEYRQMGLCIDPILINGSLAIDDVLTPNQVKSDSISWLVMINSTPIQRDANQTENNDLIIKFEGC